MARGPKPARFGLSFAARDHHRLMLQAAPNLTVKETATKFQNQRTNHEKFLDSISSIVFFEDFQRSPGAFDAQQEVLLTFPESEEVLRLDVRWICGKFFANLSWQSQAIERSVMKCSCC